jgi:hypothetical protein
MNPDSSNKEKDLPSIEEAFLAYEESALIL